jgi:hypothetical protein
MKVQGKPYAKEPFFVMQFYYSQTFPYLIEKWQPERDADLSPMEATAATRYTFCALPPAITGACPCRGSLFGFGVGW